INNYFRVVLRVGNTARFLSPTGLKVLLKSGVNAYNELGELIEKNLHSEDNGATFAQSIDYRYNIRGWLSSINNASLTDASNNNDTGQAKDLFGMEIAYNEDWTDVNNTPAFNGNISAVKWSNNLGLGNPALGDVVERSYGYNYDPQNQVTAAHHHTKTQSWNPANAYSLTNLTYDQNKNIQSLTRKDDQGNDLDVLSYDYGTGANRSNLLLAVGDGSANEEGFNDRHTGAGDYAYDDNGNQTQDLNQDIVRIAYNHLNRPDTIELTGNRMMLFTYDADGIKLSQQNYENGVLQRKVDFVGDFYYENDSLKHINHEEGRILVNDQDYTYTYYLKDHTNATRLIFTTDPQQYAFTATMESENASEEDSYFEGLDRVAFTSANHTPGGNEVVRLNNTDPMGPAISLPVNPGDTINLEAYAYYEGGSGYSNSPSLASFVAAVAGAFGGVNGGTEAQQATFDAFDNAYGTLGLNGTGSDNVPAAYLNYIFFDQNMVYQQSGFTQISSAANTSHERVAMDNIIIKEAGFIFCFLTNESNSPNWMYWDDFTVSLNESPVLESIDYYPGGLEFSGTTYSRVTNTKTPYRFQGMEQISDFGLDWVHTYYRDLDKTTMRWRQIDPKASERESPFVAFANNPLKYVDPLGDTVRVYFFDQADNPDNKRVYTADVYVKTDDGTVNGPYSGSTYPNAPDSKNTHKTIDEGEHAVNNEYGHSSGLQKGLNLVDDNGDRKTPATTTPGDEEATAKYINVHSGQPKNAAGLHNRGSEGCLTLCPTDASNFFDNFDWSGSYNGHTGNTGNSVGTVNVFRGESEDSRRVKFNLQFTQKLQNTNFTTPVAKSDATRMSQPVIRLKRK
ncbi:MAG: RHS repeat-associated core domain-containing protein, partial [Bacteroidota bacterium]